MADTLAPEKIEQCKQTFGLFDKRGNGFITADELGTVMRSLGKHPTNKDLERIIEVDLDNKTSVDFPEFLHIMAQQDNEITEDDLVDAFKVFDKENNGFIDAAELRGVMTSLAETFSDEEVDEMIKEADTNGDGQVNYREFAKLMCK